MPKFILDTGAEIDLEKGEQEAVEKSLSNAAKKHRMETAVFLRSDEQKIVKARKDAIANVVKEAVFFKARGTFQGSKPDKKSPYQTAGPFFSNTVIGRVIFPPGTKEANLHKTLSRALNDRHQITGMIGDWRVTHSPQYKGIWSYKYERFVQVRIGTATRYIPLETVNRAEGE